MKQIELTKGYVALVDDADFDKLNQYGWYAIESDGVVYARTHDGVYMQNILIPDTSNIIDHKDRDGLNNQRDNLREATSKQNGYNRVQPQTINGSGYRGVGRVSNQNGSFDRWYARIRVEDGRRIHLGCFSTPEDAAHAYDEAAREHHGEFAVLNFPAETAPVPSSSQSLEY